MYNEFSVPRLLSNAVDALFIYLRLQLFLLHK